MATTETRERLLEKVRRFPTSAGVYLMKDEKSRILYIGKALNLRARVRSYFGQSSDSRIFHEVLVGKTHDVDCIVAESEAEALILENNLIKKHRPVYNIRLKDDKSYVSIKLTVGEQWPRMHVVRRYRNDGSLYFGPYGSASSVRETKQVVESIFKLRSCTNADFQNRTRPCTEYEMGRCTAPCVGFISENDYREDVREAELFLRGRNKDLEKLLEDKMHRAAEDREFELAARYRDQIRAIRRVFETQKAQEFHLGDIDVFSLAREGEFVAICELLIRGGKIVNSQCHTFRTTLASSEILSSFLSQYYLESRYIPSEILVSEEFPDAPLLEVWLREKAGGKVGMSFPKRGEKARILELARKNALNRFSVDRTESERQEALQESLAKHLGMERAPRRIECFDISNFQGSLAVGAMVTFEDGSPVKSRYRKFRIQTVVGADDFRCMEEVLERRLRRGLEEGDLPDLMVIDGGKGQLGVAVGVLEKLEVEDVAVVGLAKERRRRGTSERIFAPGRSSPLPVEQDAPESLYLQRIRDEAHRFAIRYHRELRGRQTLRTGLEHIRGVGRKKTEALIDRFGSLKKIRESAEEEIAEVIGPKLAARVYRELVEERAESPGDEPADPTASSGNAG